MNRIAEMVVAYDEWNDRALTYFFGGEDDADVCRLDVSDPVLEKIAGSKSSIVASVRNYLKEENESELRHKWGFQCRIGTKPDYFAFLVATCRLEWERESGQFAGEFGKWLGVRPQPWIELIPKLWIGLEKFLSSGKQDAYRRRLVLPEHYRSFSNIGHTVGLVFPRRSDRTRLSAMFAGVSDSEPTIAEVCALLESTRGLSKECRREADWFRKNVTSNPNDERVVRFWHVLRQALEFSEFFQNELDGDSDITLSFWSDEDGIFEPWLFLRDGADIPSQFSVMEGAKGVAGWSRVLALHQSERSSGLSLFVHENDELYEILCDRTRAFLRDGVIPLVESESLADVDWLVPSDLFEGRVAAHVFHEKSEFAKYTQDAKIRSERMGDSCWRSCFGAEGIFKQISKKRLVKRTPRLTVLGVRFRSNEYLNLPGFRPRVECDGATVFELVALHSNDDGNSSNVFDPSDINRLSGETMIFAKTDDGTTVAKKAVSFIDQLPAVLTAHWSLFKQSYWMPAPTVALGGRSADQPYPEFLLGGQSSAVLPDTTLWQSDEIWLGPRVGDVSSRKQPGFEWKLAESVDRNKRLLCFVGDCSCPTMPELAAVNSHKGACRLWRRTFDPVKTKCLNPKWAEIFNAYSALRVPRDHKRKLGREFERFDGGPPPIRKRVEFDDKEIQLHAGVHVLESVLRARVSGKQSPLCWQTLWEDCSNAFGLNPDSFAQRSVALGVLRAWQETGVFDTASTAWGGMACVVRRPQFLLRQVDDHVVATLVGLTGDSLRRSIQRIAEEANWKCRLKFSTSEYIPPILEIRKPCETGSSDLDELSADFGLTLPQALAWENADELPCNIVDLGDPQQFFHVDEGGLPATRPLWTKPIDGSKQAVSKYNPQRQPPIWAIGPINRKWAICTSADWAWRLAYLAADGKLPYSYANGLFRRVPKKSAVPVNSIYLPLEVGRLLTVISTTLPGPTGQSGYEYRTPSEIAGTLLADRMSIAKA